MKREMRRMYKALLAFGIATMLLHMLVESLSLTSAVAVAAAVTGPMLWMENKEISLKIRPILVFAAGIIFIPLTDHLCSADGADQIVTYVACYYILFVLFLVAMLGLSVWKEKHK